MSQTESQQVSFVWLNQRLNQLSKFANIGSSFLTKKKTEEWGNFLGDYHSSILHFSTELSVNYSYLMEVEILEMNIWVTVIFLNIAEEKWTLRKKIVSTSWDQSRAIAFSEVIAMLPFKQGFQSKSSCIFQITNNDSHSVMRIYIE